MEPIFGQLTADLRVESEGEGQGGRRLVGTVVPWGVVGLTSAGPTRYEPGSLSAEARPPVDRDHDGSRLVGRVVDAQADDVSLRASVRLSRTPLADETLALAADGVTAGLSATVRPQRFHYEDDPEHGSVLVVEQGEWIGLAVTAHPAYSEAQIERVAASRGPHSPQEGTTMNTDLLLRLMVAGGPERRHELTQRHAQAIEASGLSPADWDLLVQAEEEARQPAPVPVPFTAGPVAYTRPRLPLVSAGAYAQQSIRAQQGHSDAIAAVQHVRHALAIEATISEESSSSSVGVVPPFYTSDIIGSLNVSTPVSDNLVRKTNLPATGMSIVKPVWDDLPDGDWYVTENSEAPSSAVTVGTDTVPVLSFAHAVKASINLVERSDFGGFATAYYSRALVNYRSKKEQRIVATMVDAINTGPGHVTLTGSTAKAHLLELVRAVITQQLDVNGVFQGLMPDFAALDPVAWEDLVGTDTDAGAAFTSVNVPFNGMAGNLGGLTCVLVPSLLDTAGTAPHYLVGSRAATALHDGQEMQLRSLLVSTLQWELGVHANVAIDVEYPNALASNVDDGS